MTPTGKFTPDAKDVAFEHQSLNGYVHRQSITTPILADVDRVLNDQATSNSVVTTVTTFLADPDVPRNVTITPGGTTADVAAGNYVVAGTNIRNEVISDTIVISANASTLQSGTKAFKTFTTITFPIQDGAAATFDVGVGDVLGLDRMLQGDEILHTTFDGTYEGTRPTVLNSTSAIESNTADINGTLNGAKDVVFIVMTKEII